jgi:hypothetical protein
VRNSFLPRQIALTLRAARSSLGVGEMNFCKWHVKLWLASSVLILNGACLTYAQEKSAPPAVPVTVSSGSTNSQRLAPRESGLKQLEDELFRPLQGFSPKSSLDAISAPVRMPPPANQNERNPALDRKKDWVFMNPEELMGTRDPEDVFGTGPGEKHKKELSPMEKYIQRLYHSNEHSKQDAFGRKQKREDNLSGNRKESRGDKENEKEKEDENGDLPPELRDTETRLKKMFEPPPVSKAGKSPSLIQDLFGLGTTERSREELEGQRERREEYKKMLHLPSSPILGLEAPNPLAGLFQPVQAAPTSAGIPDVSLPKSTGGNHFGSPAGFPGISALTEPSRPFGQPSLSPVLPKAEPAHIPVPTATFTAPRRQF